jgi:glycosyltransferase involved in cell wall biosynthesis
MSSIMTQNGVPLAIGLPVYNGERYLAEAIDSILVQDFAEFELVIFDNASTDGTADIAMAATRRDRRVRYVRQPANRGAARNFNDVFLATNARYFKWACADDVLEGGFLGRAVAELDAHPQAVLCYGGTILIAADGAPLGAYEQGLDLREPSVAARFRRARDHRGLLNVLQGVMRAGVLRDTRLMGRFSGSDEVLMVELALRGRLHEIAHPMLRRRMHPDAAHATMDEARRRAHIDPALRGEVSTYRLRRAVEHLSAVARTPGSIGTKLKLAGIVIRSAIMIRDELWMEARDVMKESIRSHALPKRP